MYEFITTTKSITITEPLLKDDKDEGYCHKYTITSSPYDLDYQNFTFRR